jgi:CDP-2,3-bis-(O-geranylgeranyl)-sn-glycerol synthase
MDFSWNMARALLLLVVANSTPWVVARLAGSHWATPLDLGFTMPDGEPLLGNHKTWRGLVSATLACGLVAALWDFGALRGCGFGALVLLGDGLSSLLKRRMHRRPGAEIPVLDQLPEALLPLYVFASPLGLGAAQVAGVVVVFALLDMAATRIRQRPPAKPSP